MEWIRVVGMTRSAHHFISLLQAATSISVRCLFTDDTIASPFNNNVKIISCPIEKMMENDVQLTEAYSQRLVIMIMITLQ